MSFFLSRIGFARGASNRSGIGRLCILNRLPFSERIRGDKLDAQGDDRDQSRRCANIPMNLHDLSPDIDGLKCERSCRPDTDCSREEEK
jgi:hypothetical protein